MAATVAELKWISFLLQDFVISPSLPIPLWCDNWVALHIIENLVFHECTKHHNIDCHFVCAEFKFEFLLSRYVSSHDQVAHLFTKALSVPMFTRLRSKLSLVELPLLA